MVNKLRANKGSGNIIDRDDWETPQQLFGLLHNQYNFQFDCCADKDNSKCNYWSEDFLDEIESQDSMSWMNPPFSKALHMFDHFFKVIKQGVCIYRCDNMETKLWQEVILKNATWIFIPKGRINYEGKKGNWAVFPSALIGFNVEPIKDMDGTTLFVIRSKNG